MKYDILQLNDMLVPELKVLAKQLGVKNLNKLNKQELIRCATILRIALEKYQKQDC